MSAPKLYPGDTGLALHLAGIADVAALERLPRPGVWLEGLVLGDLLAWIHTRSPKPSLYHYRTATGQEVDFVLESGQRRLPIEVKSSPAVRPDDGRVIEGFCAEHGERAPFGVVLYTGRERVRLTTRSIAIGLGTVIRRRDVLERSSRHIADLTPRPKRLLTRARAARHPARVSPPRMVNTSPVM